MLSIVFQDVFTINRSLGVWERNTLHSDWALLGYKGRLLCNGHVLKDDVKVE